MEINKEKIDEIIEDYPEKLSCYPRAIFEEQLRRYLCKHFKIKYKSIFVQKKKEGEKLK